MNELETEKLRMSLLKLSLDFVNQIKDASFLAFVDVEKRAMIQILYASPEVLQAFDTIRKSTSR